MKITIYIPLIFISLNSFARNYYVDASRPDDSGNGLTPASAWRTIGKVNLQFAVFNPGDSVLFKRGQTFYGSLIVNKSGTLAAPIIISTYGSGAKPVLTSLLTLSGFTLTATNRYESATTSALLSTVRVVLVDGVIYGMGRYPNENIANKGYLNFESFSGKTSITDNQLSTSPNNWTGAEAVVRTTNFSLEPRTITNHSGGTLTYAATVQAPTSANYGYFIQNDIRTLDKYGEWYYNSSTKKLSVYLTSAASGHTIQVSSLANTVVIDGPDYITFDNLSIQGANDYEFLAKNNTGLVIKNCDLLHSGIGAVILTTSTTTTLQNNTVTNSLMCGFNINNSNSTTITGNAFYNTYAIAGMGGIFNSENGNAVWLKGNNNTVQSNSFINSGSCPVNFRGTGVLVKNNFIDSFSFVKSDIGGIYTYIGAGNVTSNTAIVEDNIILHGIGAPEGSAPGGNSKYSGDGIYIDVAGANCTIRRNYIAYCYKGIFCHAATKITIRDNTFFANRLFQTDITSRAGDPARQMVVKKNIMFVNNNSQKAIELVSDANNLGLIGSIDSNAYVNYTGVNPFTTVNPGTTNQLFAAWKTATGYDPNSTQRLITNTDVILASYALAVNNIVNLTPYAWSDAKSASFSNSLTLIAYTSAVLLRGTTVNVHPTVTLTSPTDGSTSVAPSTISLAATASDADGTVAVVKFYNGSILIGTDATSPYTFSWTNVGAGGYSLTAHATDNFGDSTISAPVSITVSAPINTPPTITLTSPVNGATYTAPATITLSATASDPDGTIVAVRWYDGSTLIDTDATNPYMQIWLNVPAGIKTLTAHAIDNRGDSTISAPITITVNNALPVVSLTSPANGATYTSPASITLSATATDANGTIVNVKFYNGSTLIAVDATSPYSFVWTGVTQGGYSITAHALDNLGDSTISNVANITVSTPANVPPTISVTAPANGATYTAPATVNITATASDADGTITQVNFFNGSVFIGTDATSPYTFSWTSVAAGTYSITAHARDNDGDSTISAPITITVSAPANIPPVVNLTSPADGATFTPPATIVLSATASDADGTIVNVKFYNGSTLIATDASSPYSFNWSGVSQGGYSITAHALDNSGDSTISTAANITVTAPANLPPTGVSITNPNADTTFNIGGSVTFVTTGTDPDGTITNVKFYSGTTLLNNDVSSPYSFAWTPTATGVFSITAVYFDNSGDSTVSTAKIVTVTDVPIPLQIVVAVDSILCNGGSSNVSVDGIGGTPPYTGTGNSAAVAGNHQYIITDAVGTKDTADILITQPAVLSASASVGTILNFNGSTTATVTASGGVPPYEYSINNGPWRASNVFTIKAGTYTIRVRDANGCIVVITPFSVTQPSPGNNLIIKNTKHIYFNL